MFRKLPVVLTAEELLERSFKKTKKVQIVDRNALYDCYYILHSVPRFNNPSGTFDNDQYLVKDGQIDGRVKTYRGEGKTFL